MRSYQGQCGAVLITLVFTFLPQAAFQMHVGPVRSKMLETISVLLSSNETHLGLRFQGVDMGYAYTKSALMRGDKGGPPTLKVCQHMSEENTDRQQALGRLR